MWGWDYIKSEWSVMKAAPLAFALLFLAGGWIGYKFDAILTSEHIATLNTMIQERDGKITGLEKTISDRLDKVEKALSDQQISSIKSSLKTDPSSSVDIVPGRPDKPDPRADQFKSIFKDSGWSVGSSETSAVDSMILRAQDGKSATSIEKALNNAGVVYEAVKPPSNTGTDFVLGPFKG